MGLKKIEKSELKQWKDAYCQKINDGETKNCLISLTELKELISYIESYNQRNQKSEHCDGIRIHLTRPDITINGKVNLPDKTTVRQISFAIVPTKNYSNNFQGANGTFIWGANNCYENGESVCLFPGGISSEHSGLCPTNCGGDH